LALAQSVPEVSYSIKGAAFLLRLPERKVRQLANGYTYQTSYGKRVFKKPLLATDREDPEAISFYELIELMYVKHLAVPERRNHKVGRRLEEIREMVEYLAKELGAYPLARANLATVGKQLVTDETGQGLINAKMGQLLLAYAEEMVKHLDFDPETELATAWHPMPDEIVVVSPDRRFGLPTVGKGVSTAAIRDRELAGDSTEEIAEWFGVSDQEVTAALEFEAEWRKDAA
jgi:uncharacterized protein (DUF433 family)